MANLKQLWATLLVSMSISCGAQENPSTEQAHESETETSQSFGNTDPENASLANAALTRESDNEQNAARSAEHEADSSEEGNHPEEPPGDGGSNSDDEIAAILAPDAELSRSIGGPSDGSVEGAIAIPRIGRGFRFNERRPDEARFGTGRMVRALIRAAQIVHDQHQATVTFGDLGLEAGGPIAGHGSHRAGRDVDVLFYLVDADGNSIPSVGAFLNPEGAGVDFRDLESPDDDVDVYLDVPRTWAFVEALIQTSEEEGLPLHRAFVVEHIRAALLEHAQEVGADEAVIQRFSEITCQPGAPHDDHFHFRFFCAAEDIEHGCADPYPHYPWRRRELAQRGIDIVPHRPRPNRPMAPVVGIAEARANAGPMHERVEEWLDAREAWQNSPNPGRRFCR